MIIILILLLIAVLALLFMQMNNKTIVNNQPESSADDSKMITKVEDKAIAFCEDEIKNCPEGQDCEVDSYKYDCIQNYYGSQARELGKTDYCDFLADDLAKVSCSDSVNMSLATKNRSIENCQKLSQPDQVEACKGEVYFYLAMSDPDNAEDYCNKITASENLKKVCLDKFVK